MTSGFEQQEPLTDRAFSRQAAQPRPAGVRLPADTAAQPAAGPERPARPTERKTF
jgi:hypothetical protein